MPESHTKTAKPDIERGDEVALTPRQQSALRSGLHDLQVSNVSIDFNQRLISALLSGRDLRPWYEQVGTRLRWMLPAVLVGFGVTLALAYRQNLPQQTDAEKRALPGFSSVAPPPLLPLPTRFVNAAQPNEGTTTVQTVNIMNAKKIIGKEARHEAR
jgi:hypothetical protein